MLTIRDRLDINELLALHAHILDANRLDRLEELFTSNAVYDMTATGSGVGALRGIDAIRAAAGRMAESGRAPIAHFVTNVIAMSTTDDAATVTSRGLMIMSDGSLHAVSHDDVLQRRGADQSPSHHPSWRSRSCRGPPPLTASLPMPPARHVKEPS